MVTQRIKYPRTSHLPWSPGASEDDVICDLHTSKLASGKLEQAPALQGFSEL